MSDGKLQEKLNLTRLWPSPEYLVVKDYWAQYTLKKEECIWNKITLYLRTPKTIFSQWLPFQSMNYALYNQRYNFSVLVVTQDDLSGSNWCITKTMRKLFFFNPLIPMSDKTEFLLTISIQYQPDKWWEKRKKSIWG